jgi:hypothetical protein
MKIIYTGLNRVYLVISFILIISTGCRKEWLEVKADKSQAVPATVKDFQAMLDNVGVMNRSSVLLNEIAADGYRFSENDYNSVGAPGGALFIQNAYTWTGIHSYKDVLSGYLLSYTSFYSSVLNMNVILSEATKSKDPDKRGLEQVKAQALFIRARNFFELAQIFAPPYKQGSSNTELGIALRLNTDITEPSIRSTVKQTYEQIISDLIAAKDILPNSALYTTRASQPAVLGMLAKVYLSMNDYTNAFNYANEYLKIKSQLLDYGIISPLASSIGANEEIAFLSYINPGSYLSSSYLVDQDLYNSYDQNDLRKSIFFISTPQGINFKGSYAAGSTVDRFRGIATDEIYLIRAEAYARIGNLNAAMKDLNDLLKSRYSKNPDGSTKYVNQVASNETDALNKIFIERRKQLILRNVRWTDLRRLNQDHRFAVTLTRNIGGQTYTLEPNSYKYTFPFPVEILQKSSMQQNPGWE